MVIEQPHWHPAEFATVVEWAKIRYEHPRVLEIGTFRGGSALALRGQLDPEILVTVDLNYVPGLTGITMVVGDSHDQSVVARVSELVPVVDLLVIDGDHSHRGVSDDWWSYRPLVPVGGMVVLHDVSQPTAPGYEVWDFWHEYVLRLVEFRSLTSATRLDCSGDGTGGTGIVVV